MSEKKNNRFKLRNFVSVLLTFSFAVLVFTGAILFITPPGRIAHWTGWKILGLGKEQWGAIHICFSVCVVIVSVIHICLNIRPLINYFKNRLTNKFTIRPEWAAAALICLAIFVGTVISAPPFSSIMNINDMFKFSWSDPAKEAPIPHAEMLTLAELAEKADLELEEIIANLKAAKIEPAKSETVIKQLAKKHNLTPVEVYDIAAGGKSMPENSSSQSSCGGQKKGLGKKTLKQFCDEEDIEIQSAIEILEASQITASSDETLRQIADRATISPGQIASMITSSQSN